MKLTYYTGDGVELMPAEASLYGTNDVLRQMVRASLRRFVAEHAELLRGRVLDYGCGRPGTCAIPSPYRSLLSECEYVGWDVGETEPKGYFDAVLCTQVLQHADDPGRLLFNFRDYLKLGGALVLTAPALWEEIELEQWRFTLQGLWALAHRAGFQVLEKRSLCSVVLDRSLTLSVVNGIVARRAK